MWGKTRRWTGGRKVVWKEKWNLKKADWMKYCRDMEEVMPGERERERERER